MGTGGRCIDWLLFYREMPGEDVFCLVDRDWNTFVVNPDVALKSLHWVERIENHGGGFTKDGGMIFF